MFLLGDIMIQTVKEWKSIDDQIEIIRSRGMAVEDDAKATQLLKYVGYYRLSGYWYPFRQVDPETGKILDTFVESSRFSDVVDLYLFDRKLRILALDAIERIELAIQVEIAHRLGARDPFAHENPNELHGKFSIKRPRDGEADHEKWLEDFRKNVNRSKRKPFVAHNIDKYGKLPIWAAVEVFDFGILSKLYAGLQFKDKIAIESQFGLVDGKHLQTWLRSLNFIRNTAAHHSRLWNCNILERASVPHVKRQLSKLKDSRPFLCFCIMQSILKVICPDSDWGQRFVDLLAEFPNVENEAIKIDDMGVVDGWEEWNIWR